MTNYYFLATVLPEIRVGEPLEITFEELMTLFHDNLTSHDFEKIRAILRYFDIQNIRAFWKGEEIDNRGIFNSLQLEEALLTQMGFPPYVYDFIDKYENNPDRLAHFSDLVLRYMDAERSYTSGFLLKYLNFERDFVLILAALRAKKLGKDIVRELQNEDPESPIVAQIIAQKDSKIFEPPDRYDDLKALFEAHQDNPIALLKALCEYRFAKIDELLGDDFFSSDRIVGYFLQYLIVENWLKLDKQKGIETMDNILKGVT